MNPTIVLTFLRQRFTSPMRLVFMGGIGFFSVALSAGMGVLQPFDQLAGMFALILTAGAIGQDVSSGVLQLTFSRPITRRDFVVSRWLAGGLGASVLFLVLLAAACAAIVARGGHLEPGAVAVLAGQNVAAAFGTAAIVVMLSSLAPGLGDVALYFMSLASLTVAQNLGAWKQWAWMELGAVELQHTLQPALPLAWLQGGDVPWAALATYASAVTLALAVAVIVVNRKELSYASG